MPTHTRTLHCHKAETLADSPNARGAMIVPPSGIASAVALVRDVALAGRR
jgi:hypothetical protein